MDLPGIGSSLGISNIYYTAMSALVENNSPPINAAEEGASAMHGCPTKHEHLIATRDVYANADAGD